MSNYAQLTIDVYKALRDDVAPGTDVGLRFLRSVCGWAVYTLLARCCRNQKPSPESERENLSLAAIAGIAARSQGRDWLTEQVDQAATSLCDPTPRQRAETEELKFAKTMLDAHDLKRAEDLQRRSRKNTATRNSDHIEGARREFWQYMNASGAFNRGQPLDATGFRPDLQQKFVDRAKQALEDLPATELAFGSPLAGAEVRQWLKDGGFDAIVEGYTPAFDDDWMADHELASEEAEEAGNWERHQSELQNIRDEIVARNGTAS